MADEIYTSDGAPRETTIIHETRSSGGAGWVIAVVLIIALIAGIWFFTQSNRSQVARDNAVAAAAHDVGSAARDVGNAAQDAANNATK
jgi:hypothetical protein